MSKIYISFCLMLSVLSASVEGFSQASSWYKRFSGTIGKNAMILHLHKMQHYFAGYFYNPSDQRLIYMIGNDSAGHDGKIRLYPLDPDGESPNQTMILSVSGKTCKGTWQKNTASKPVAVTATEGSVAPVSYDMVYLNGTERLRPHMKESPEAFFEAGTVWPRLKPGNKVDLALRTFITTLFGAGPGETDIKKILQNQRSQFFKEYREDNKEVADSEMVEYPSSYNYEESHWVIVAYQSPRLLTLADWAYTFMGGAHGNSNVSYNSIDLSTGKLILLEHVLLPSGIRKLDGLLQKYFRINRKLTKDQDLTEGGLFEDKLEHNENFYLTGKGIAFSYAPYEIASYADGQIEIFIPFTELSKDLQPAFRKLIQ